MSEATKLPPHLEFRGISIAYSDKEIVHDVDISVPRGGVVTLVGKNGCGKSSILKTLTDTVDAKAGEVYVDGRPIRDYKRKELAHKLSVLPQVWDSIPDIDVRTLVGYGRFPYKKFGRGYFPEDERIIEETLAMTGLEALEFRKLHTLSGGERQRARIAMAICQRPEILVLDEPTTYLDISYQIEVLELIQRINREMRISILMVLHDLNLAARYSDRLYVIGDHTIHSQGGAEEIITPRTLEDAFQVKIALWEGNPSGRPFFMPIGRSKK